MIGLTQINAGLDDHVLGAVDVTALIPIGALVGLIGVLVAAAWAARSAIVVRLLDAQRAEAERFAQFQQDTVAAVNELGLSMARHIEQTIALATAVRLAAEYAPPGATAVAANPDPEWKTRVDRATEGWRLILARAHAFGGEELHGAISAVDQQRAVVVEHANARQWEKAQFAIDQMREYEARQVYRRLQVVSVEREIAMMRLVQTRRLRREMKRAEAYAIETLERGEQMIAAARREHEQRGEASHAA